ncbi:FAD:protein FMN transferase [Adhaeribacter sp. BT258]|uniref:FAD:protein FMN transferase n=1 Tax=Adhaeribacter terrigena TaxID=2793070 RepID=A0ABS1C123_9BACT|nr:FAD:protein FMN transferase [Adhaeribacter terrigena]MBK0403028.1 FAD:protein FMN transferase [Adhaeribacter terrigena]
MPGVQLLSPVTETTLHKRVLKLMGNRFEFSVAHEDPTFAQTCLDAAVTEVQHLEKLLTTFSETSQTSQINAMAGIKPVKVDPEVFDLIARSIRISELTQGAFDITYGSVDKRLWNFDTSLTALPDPATAREMVKLVNYRNMILDPQNHTVFLKEKGMRIGFGGIGKGFAAEKAKAVLVAMGIKSGVVNAAGDLCVWGKQPNNQPWTIGIADPNAKHLPFSSFQLTNAAVATSGDYEKFVMIGGKRYSHTIDPKTGLPVSGLKSVTVICPNAELADAMATPLLVLGLKKGLHLVNQMKHIACIYIDEQDRVHTSAIITVNNPKTP